MTLFKYITTMIQGRETKLIKALVVSLLLSFTLNACSPESDSLDSVYNNKRGSYPLTTRHLDDKQEPLFVNRLIKQDSLYLLQHAHNPVQWWSWGDEALAAAKQQGKPILLSIGYSTCHWCHVMARESFEDIEIANFINDNFIPIKVDREEHPDIDELYLTSVQMLSGQAGWPLTAVLTPNGQAFFGGTYFKPGKFINVLNKINDTWAQRREAVIEQAERLEAALKNINKSSNDSKAIDEMVINEAVTRIQHSFAYGQPGPGFPREPEMLLLLNNALLTPSNKAINIIIQRLNKLAAGGLHDHVGGGFHRYTVDSNLAIPHFEKMLYNQAQMGQVYFRAYQLSGDQALRSIGESTFAYLLNELQSPDGGFYAAMDAESERADGEKGEGAFYIWSYDELSSGLSEQELALARSVFGVSPLGNFNGLNVLLKALPNSQPSAEQAIYSQKQIDAVLTKLANTRAQRTPPRTDTKIITSWNSMAISALVEGYKATQNEAYRVAALKAAERLWKKAYSKSDGLYRTVPVGKRSVSGALEDYAYLTVALIDLFDLEGDSHWLERAELISQQMIKRFKDSDTGGFLISNKMQQTRLIVALMTARDDAINSGNSMAAQGLARLFLRTGNTDYRLATRDVLSAFSKQLLANPESLSGMLVAASLLNQGEIASTQYGAKGKVTIKTQVTGRKLTLNVDIEKGWHINAYRVLDKHLVPTVLSPIDSECATVNQIDYPEGKIVSLGFQDDDLLVYEGTITISAGINLDTQGSNCRVVAAQLHIQACSDEVCQAPEILQVRVPLLPRM